MDDSEDILDNFGLEKAILRSRNENCNYITSKTSVNIGKIRVEDTIVFIVTHEVPYCVAVAISLLEGCITLAIDNCKDTNRNILLISLEFL